MSLKKSKSKNISADVEYIALLYLLLFTKHIKLLLPKMFLVVVFHCH